MTSHVSVRKSIFVCVTHKEMHETWQACQNAALGYFGFFDQLFPRTCRYILELFYG